MKAYCYLKILLTISCLDGGFCSEKVYRAYVPALSAKWFNEYLNSQPYIDVWLSMRLNHLNESSERNFKYIAEFRTIGLSLPRSDADSFDTYGIKLQVLINNLTQQAGNVFKKIRREARLSPYSIDSRIIGRYVSHERINEWMASLARKYAHLVQVIRIGKTLEKRPIMALRLTHNTRSKISKPLFLFDGGIHAREWLAVATVTHMIDMFLNQFLNSDPTVMKILNRFELHFIPLINPDGYEYSRSSSETRFWRKNRRPYRGAKRCTGVDLNRNFDYQWMKSGSSANPCSDVYAGPNAGSELEIRALTKYIMAKSPRWVSHVSFHSYGAMWLSPFSYSKRQIQDNFEETCHKALLAIKEMDDKHDIKFRFGSAAFELYEASGCSEDWSREVAKINHTYVIELRPEKSDTPEAGFDHPEREVLSSAMEIYDGFLVYVNSFIKHGVEDHIVVKCKAMLNEMLESLDEPYLDTHSDDDYN